VGSRTFVDTNVLLYVFDKADTRRGRIAREILAGIGPGNTVLSIQVLQEFYWNATRKLRPPLTREEAAGVLAELSLNEVVVPDATLVLRAVGREESARISFWDGLIVEAALSAGCTRLLTEDLRHGRAFDGLVVENPFRAKR